jgi:HPt (histidine-containing phosphotransfer) domain-containing protein
MTANIMSSELEKYKKLGMPDCLGKPFTSQELWHILLKYLKPVDSDPVNEYEDNGELQKKLLGNFYKSSQDVHSQITEAVAAGDTKLAHRLAHSLKGNAGLIGKIRLRNAAAEVEELLKDGAISIWEIKMDNLKTELLLVLEELRRLHGKTTMRREVQVIDAGQIIALFERLKPMLENLNPESAGLLGEINAVPGAGKLAQQIEDYDFESAARTLAELKTKLEKDHG